MTTDFVSGPHDGQSSPEAELSPGDHLTAQILYDFCVGRLASSEAAVVSRHLARCAACARFLNAVSIADDPLVAKLRAAQLVENGAAVACDGHPIGFLQVVSRLSTAHGQVLGEVHPDPPCLKIAERPVDMPSTALFQLTAPEQAALIARYEILEEVGRGGMGVVYRARHRMLDRQVAVKICFPGTELERFQREGQLLARMRSSNVVSVHDLDQLKDGRMLLVMDWVDGADLGRIIKGARETISEQRALRWMRQVCQGMQAVSAQGVVHRDMKPSNILIDNQDNALVADFGLARSATASALTFSGGIMGTPHYMAPEQADDPRQVDTRSDIYSFGATFYHVLTGRTPFEADSWFSLLFKHKTEPLISPKALNPCLGSRTSECIERCLAKSPHDRFSSFGEVLNTLEVESSGNSPWHESQDPELAPYFEQYDQRRQRYLSRSDNAELSDQYKLPQQRAIIIAAGDITQQKVDALVSSDDSRLHMGGGVSMAIGRAAGPELRKHVQRLVPVRPGRAVVTPAGNLPARFIFHAVTMGRSHGDEGRWVSPSRDLIHEIMESCFYHADTMGVQTIAFPLLGTGVARFSTEVCLDTMFRFLVRKLSRGITTVREARIIIFRHYSA